MGLFDSLIRSLRQQPSSTGAWLRDHLARIAPSDGSPAPQGEELRKLLDELDDWVLKLYHHQNAGLWGDMLKEWRRVSSAEAIAAAMRRFGNLEWIHNEASIRFKTSNGLRGLGLAKLHDAFVQARLIDSPELIEVKVWEARSKNGESS